MRIDGTSALVAGGASGLGAATARALHAAGAAVVIADLNPDKGQALADELGEGARVVEAQAAPDGPGEGGRFVEANVTDSHQVSAAVDAAAKAEGGLPLPVCCGGIGWAQ